MTLWQQRDRARDLLAREAGYVRQPHDLPGVVCERVFLPPKQELKAQLDARIPLVTVESQTPVADFDVLAFSVSFEWDYTNVLTMMRLAGIPVRAEARPPHHPLVVLGR